VSVSAPNSASVASSILLHCKSAPSFPAPSLVWRIVDQMEEMVREAETVVEEQEDGNMIATSDLRLDAGAGLLTAQCVAKVEEMGEVASEVMEVTVMDTTTSTTTTTTTQPLGPPVVFGVRPGSVLRPREEVVLTCSAVVKGEGNLQWMVGDQLRGEEAELHRKDGKLISSWKYTAHPEDTSVACVVEGEEERSTAIELNIKEVGQETVTLRNMDDDDEEYGSEEYDEEYEEEYEDEEEYDEEYEDEEEYDEEYEEGSEEDAATDKPEADAIENLSASASLPQEEQMSAFEDWEPVARVPDAGLGESEKMLVSPKMSPSFKSSRFSSSSTSLIPSILSLLLALAACLRHY